jgi:AAA ATPase-like protein
VQLVRAHITNYRSVEDSGEFAIEPDVTCLVGKNESGKTADLQALYRLRPVDGSAVYDEVIDFPSRLTRQRKQAGKEIPAVTAGFLLTEDELTIIEDELGGGALTGPELTLTNGYRYNVPSIRFHTDEVAIIRHPARPRHGRAPGGGGSQHRRRLPRSPPGHRPALGVGHWHDHQNCRLARAEG